MDSHESLLIRYERSVRVNSSFFSAYSKPPKCILNEMVAQLQRLPFLLQHNKKRTTFNFLTDSSVSVVICVPYDVCKTFSAKSFLQKNIFAE